MMMMFGFLVWVEMSTERVRWKEVAELKAKVRTKRIGLSLWNWKEVVIVIIARKVILDILPIIYFWSLLIRSH